MSVSITGNH